MHLLAGAPAAAAARSGHLVTILASFAYALFTGFATPVQRSLWMVTLYLLGRLFYRERSPLNTIGFAALCLLALSPRSLFDSSLQMTLLAVVAIAGVAAPLLQSTDPSLSDGHARPAPRSPWTSSWRRRWRSFASMLRMQCRGDAGRLREPICRPIRLARFPVDGTLLLLRIVELLVVSCVVELAMALPMALYFHRITSSRCR